eukprot:570304-Rhodomonas_salina.1
MCRARCSGRRRVPRLDGDGRSAVGVRKPHRCDTHEHAGVLALRRSIQGDDLCAREVHAVGGRAHPPRVLYAEA